MPYRYGSSIVTARLLTYDPRPTCQWPCADDPRYIWCFVLQMGEELEIKQLRKETVPRAHPMPDITKPFVPKRYQISVLFLSSQIIISLH
jgi:hypothetical protein